MTLRPRNYRNPATILKHTYEVMLRDHPEAFDCIVLPAEASDKDEIIAVNKPVATLIDSAERTQSYGDPIQARAMLIHEDITPLELVDSSLFESFQGMQDAVKLLLSVKVRQYSFIQWEEFVYPDSDETTLRTVYVAQTLPLGRTLNAQVLYLCYPLFMHDEDIPKPKEPESSTQNQTNVGIL